jgi:hypothetical protein
MTPEEASSRAERAKQLLADPLLKDSLAANVNAAIAACSNAKDEKEAWRAGTALRAVMDATQSIASHIETAKVTAFNSQRTFVDKVFRR